MLEDQQIYQAHPVLHHYTTEDGLRGILESETLWATHYKHLNDTSEISHMRQSLIQRITPATKNVITEYARKDNEEKQRILDWGGVDTVSLRTTTDIIDGFYKVAFDKTRGGLRLVEPFITAFCSHHKDSKYAQENGLLSQWQSYSSSIGFAIVFDTKRLSNLLERKSKEYRYMAGYFSDVVYDCDGESFTNNFADFIAQLEAFVVKLVRGDEPESEALFLPFVLGTSKFKHQGFEEEREVRIVASPETRNVADTLDAMVAPDQASCERRIKKVRISESGAPYIELFESPREERLPIVRIVIGPHERQDELEARVRKMVRRLEIEVHCSRTPYVAAKGNTRHPNG